MLHIKEKKQAHDKEFKTTYKSKIGHKSGNQTQNKKNTLVDQKNN